jgi:hypothetical protein
LNLCYAAVWAKYHSRGVYLKWLFLNSCLVVSDKSACISDSIN